MVLGYRILPQGLEFEPFEYHDYTIHLNDYGDWEVYDNKGKYLTKFPHCNDAMSYIDNRDINIQD